MVMTLANVNLEATPDGQYKQLRAGSVGRVVGIVGDRFDVDFGQTVGGVLVPSQAVAELENPDKLSEIAELDAIFKKARTAGASARELERTVERLWGEARGQWTEIRQRLYDIYPEDTDRIDMFLSSPGMEVGGSRVVRRAAAAPSPQEVLAGIDTDSMVQDALAAALDGE